MNDQAILFFGKEQDAFVKIALDFVQKNFHVCDIYLGNRKQEFPFVQPEKNYSYIISYLSPWVIPAWILKKTHIAAINFHPGPPEYPGIGCTNFAIYHGETHYGVTCHHMEPQVDTGEIIAVKHFPVYKSDSVYSLTMRCYVTISVLFFEIMDLILRGNALPMAKENWTRKPYQRKELEELCKLDSKMNEAEIDRRIKATTFPDMPGAYFVQDQRA